MPLCSSQTPLQSNFKFLSDDLLGLSSRPPSAWTGAQSPWPQRPRQGPQPPVAALRRASAGQPSQPGHGDANPFVVKEVEGMTG
jgi:hypothetical protein